MTELMKRYEAETGKKATIALGDTGKNMYRPSYTQWLEAQLRWRPVSEKLEKGPGNPCVTKEEK